MSVYQEMSLIGIRAFAKMLDIEFTTSSPTPPEINAINKLIEEKLAQGIRATQKINGFTPLMLYTTYHVLDNRFDEELAKEENITVSTHLRGNNIGTSRRVNALSCAVSRGNLHAIERLLKTNKFSNPEDYEVALELVAISNLPMAIPLFAVQGCNLFTFDPFTHATPLMYACVFGHVEVAREILATNPDEAALNISSAVDDATASDLALRSNNEELISLFSLTSSLQRKLLVEAIEENNIEKVQAILNENSDKNLLIQNKNGYYRSLLADIYELPTNDFRENCIKAMENYLNQLSFKEKVNTLILTSSSLVDMNETAANYYLQQLKTIWDNRTKEDVLNRVIMPMDGFGYALPADLWDIIKQSIELNLIKVLNYSGYCPDVYDTYSDDSFDKVCSVTLSIRSAGPLVECLIENTSLFHYDLLLPTEGKPLMKIVELICERNMKMAQATTNLVKDKIYNSYMNTINGLVQQFKEDIRVPEELRKAINVHDKKSASYSLVELSAFTLYNSQAVITDESTPSDCQAVINDMSKLKL